MHFRVLLLPGSLLALLKGKPGLVLGGEEVEAHSLGCVQDLVDHLDLVSPPIAVLELCPAHVKLKAVASNVLRTPRTPLLGGDHAQHLLVGVRPLLVHIIGLARHFLEVAGSLMEERVQSCILKNLACFCRNRTCSAMTVSLLPAVALVNWSAFWTTSASSTRSNWFFLPTLSALTSWKPRGASSRGTRFTVF